MMFFFPFTFELSTGMGEDGGGKGSTEEVINFLTAASQPRKALRINNVNQMEMEWDIGIQIKEAFA